MLIPQGLAFAQIVRVPPVQGLWSGVAAMMAYALFGPSRHLMVGPEAGTAMMVSAVLTAANMESPEQRLAGAAVLAAMIGAALVIAGIFRLGAISDFLSRPILVGYINGIALVLIASQLPGVLGRGNVGKLRWQEPPECSFAGTAKLAHQQVSAQLDDELSSFEAIKLRSHLAACPECRCFRREVQSFTVRLREDEPLPAPAATILVRMRGGARLRFARPTTIALTAATLAAVTFAISHPLRPRSSAQSRTIPVPVLIKSLYTNTAANAATNTRNANILLH